MGRMSDQYTAPSSSAPEPPSGGSVARPEKNGWGFAALITGLVALIGAAIPVLNYGVWIVALAGIVLGIVALIVKHRRRGAGIAGLVLSVVALILSIVLAIVYTVFGVHWLTGYLDDSDTGSGSAGRSVEVVYEVIGDGGTADIQYVEFDDDGSSEVQSELDEDLPFEESTDLALDAVSGAANASVNAVAGRGSSTISCQIIIDGTVADQQTDTGPNAEVTCSTGN
jgi:hypothetical protein